MPSAHHDDHHLTDDIKKQFTREAHAATKRSLAKTISWRALASIDTFLIAYIVTGEVSAGAFIVSAEVVTKMVLYYLHERGWSHIKWGLKH